MKIASGIARGLKCLHENKIVHGNLRPENILLTHDYAARVSRNKTKTASQTQKIQHYLDY